MYIDCSLSKIYDTAPVFSHLRLTVDQGMCIGIGGPSGCGKTTLLRIIAGLDRAYDGTVVVAGEEQHTKSEAMLARFRRDHIGLVSQMYHVDPALTVSQNIAILSSVYGCDFDINARILQILEWLDLIPYMHVRVQTLSGGQLQRVILARALFWEPEILLLDEPTAHLDDSTQQQVCEHLTRIRQEKYVTIICTTHDDRLRDWFDVFYNFADLCE